MGHPNSRFGLKKEKNVHYGRNLSDVASLPILGCLIGGPLALWWLIARRGKDKENPLGLPLPPGPKPFPIIENLLDAPLDKPWFVYVEWFKTYGDMVYLRILGRGVVLVLRNMGMVNELLEKRSHNYSDRPPLPMLNDHMGWTFSTVTMPYGSLWRRHRRILHDHFHASAAEEARKDIGEAAIPGRFLVDIFPSMKWIPSWFPGAGWKRKAKYWADINTRVINEPFEKNEGSAVPSICSQLIEELPEEGSPSRAEDEEVAKGVCAISYLGGVDTKKAQAELDTVLHGRLPEFSDRPFLPYIQAVMKETLRWNPVGPMGFGHLVSEADDYKEYFIPKDTVVFGSTWEITHDPDVFEKPNEYIPERYLKDDKINTAVRDPSVAAFGCGRRIYSGRFFGDEALFAVISHVLAVFDIKPGLDEDGHDIEVLPKYMAEGLLQYPAPFSCRIVPRSRQAEELIRSSEFVG